MKIEKFTSAEAMISISLKELTAINNSINEVCNDLDIHDFSARIGATREDVKSLLNEFNNLIDSMTVKGKDIT